MRNFLGITLVAFMLFSLSACTKPTIYTKADFSEGTKSHKKVALLPFVVSIDTKHQSKDFTIDVAKKAEQDESEIFQEKLYAQFLERQAKGKYTIEFQDIDKTNTILFKSGVTLANIDSFTKGEIAEKLGVDSVISGTIRRSKPMSSGGAIVLGLFLGAWGSTNRVDIALNIHNRKNSDLLWKYDFQASGSVGSSAEGLAKSLMKGISKEFPYKTEK